MWRTCSIAGAQAPHVESACTEIVTLHGNLRSPISSSLAGICSLLMIDAGRVLELGDTFQTFSSENRLQSEYRIRQDSSGIFLEGRREGGNVETK